MERKDKLKTLIQTIAFNEQNFSAAKNTSEIEILHAGEWEHPQYGIIRITDEDIDKFIASFDDKVRKVDIAVDQEHMPEKGAAGWYRSLKKVFEDGKTKLKATIEWTKLGTQLIKDGIFKYFSPEFDFQYEDLETHEVFDNVLLGGGLTNRPYFKSLAPVELSENVYAGFINSAKKGGEQKMLTKEELIAKLTANPNFTLGEKATDEEKKLFSEAKADIEAAEKKKAEDKKKKEEEEMMKKKEMDKKHMSENFISRADHVKEMNELKSQLGVVEKKLQFKEISDLVDGFIFSESNVNGTLLSKNKDKAVEILMASNEKVQGLFKEFVTGLPKVSAKLFKEEGGEGEGKGDKSAKLDEAIAKVQTENKGMKYSEALKIVSRENPELVK